MGHNNENFRLLIRMAMSKEMSWTALSFCFNDMTSTLVKSKLVIEALLEELQTLQGKQSKLVFTLVLCVQAQCSQIKVHNILILEQ